MIPQESLWISELSRRGTASAGELAAAMGVSQPTVSRRLAVLPSSRLHRIGSGRATRYAWRREIDGETRWPLYRIDSEGRSHRVATLHALSDGSWHVEAVEPWRALEHPMFPNGLYPDWPWFLDDLRPGGFLGRLFARTCAESLPVPADPRDWTADHTLRALLRFGADLPGGFVVGARSLGAAGSAVPDAVAESPSAELLLAKAQEVLEGHWPGSSAAGEQPKFPLTLAPAGKAARRLLVKFCGNRSDPAQSRWADLLRAEHLANRILAQAGIPAARTELHEAGARLFLVSERFDRTAAGGRNVMVTLHALNAAFGDVNRSWAASAADLREQGWIDGEGAERLGLIWAFGQRIGNTDMHDGNASLFLTGDRPLSLTPVYDMTPMSLAPRPDGSLPERLPDSVPCPMVVSGVANRAERLARQFFEGVQSDPAFTPGFRRAFQI